MKTFSFTLSVFILFVIISGCNKENSEKNDNGPYQIDSIVYNLYDMNSDTIIYNYTFTPNNNSVFETVSINGDTITYISKDSYINVINSNTTVITKSNKIIQTKYYQPIGIFAQDGLVTHNFYFYNTNNKIDSIVHFMYNENNSQSIDTIREVFPITYNNGDLVFDTSGTSYSNFNNQKDLIGLDVNEFIAAYYSTIHTNGSEDYLYGIRDDIREFPYNCIINNFNTFNSNSQHLFKKLGGYDISYTFDVGYNNRIKEIEFYLESQKYQHYTFYYKQ